MEGGWHLLFILDPRQLPQPHPYCGSFPSLCPPVATSQRPEGPGKVSFFLLLFVWVSFSCPTALAGIPGWQEAESATPKGASLETVMPLTGWLMLKTAVGGGAVSAPSAGRPVGARLHTREGSAWPGAGGPAGQGASVHSSCGQGKSQAHTRAPLFPGSPRTDCPPLHPLLSVAAGDSVGGVSLQHVSQLPPAPLLSCVYRRCRGGTRSLAFLLCTGLVGIPRSEPPGSLGSQKGILPPQQWPGGGGREANVLALLLNLKGRF